MVWSLVLRILRYVYKAESLVKCQVSGVGKL